MCVRVLPEFNQSKTETADNEGHESERMRDNFVKAHIGVKIWRKERGSGGDQREPLFARSKRMALSVRTSFANRSRVLTVNGKPVSYYVANHDLQFKNKETKKERSDPPPPPHTHTLRKTEFALC